ncbi:hypothetical protein [Bacillus mobilis]|uniref:hypothetical protein n=1 Tax=Bacillus mobilis TaxID=2026190 RepID=UPI002E234D0B|nr:hypothetical protein [Bacillus mobilis]MED0956314.1 hypothetical protein [Bacillus mobilis]
MGEGIHKRDIALENLEAASKKIDPYIEAIREAEPKSSKSERHLTEELNRRKWKKGYSIFKEWFTFRSIIYGIPVAIITWFFTLDVIFGFCILVPSLAILIGVLINYIVKIKTLQDMTDESKKDYFHYYAYTNHRREYEIFSPYLLGGNNFKFQHAFELLKEWNKDRIGKDDMILKLEQTLKKTAHDAENLPVYAQQEMNFITGLQEKLLGKIERKAENALYFHSMDFFGHFAIYRLDKSSLILEHSSRKNKCIPNKVNIKEKRFKGMSYIKVLDSSYAWEADSDSTISFILEVDGTVYVYTVMIDNRNRLVLNKDVDNGKINIDRFAEVISTAFKLLFLNVSNK